MFSSSLATLHLEVHLLGRTKWGVYRVWWPTQAQFGLLDVIPNLATVENATSAIEYNKQIHIFLRGSARARRKDIDYPTILNDEHPLIKAMRKRDMPNLKKNFSAEWEKTTKSGCGSQIPREIPREISREISRLLDSPGNFPGSWLRSDSFPGKFPGCAANFPGNFLGNISREISREISPFPGKFPRKFPGKFPGKFHRKFPGKWGNIS